MLQLLVLYSCEICMFSISKLSKRLEASRATLLPPASMPFRSTTLTSHTRQSFRVPSAPNIAKHAGPPGSTVQLTFVSLSDKSKYDIFLTRAKAGSLSLRGALERSTVEVVDNSLRF
jgi:hypothetical protein